MTTIHKYPFQITDKQEVQMPRGARVIHVGLDPQGTPCIWAGVDPEKPPKPVNIVVVGTGNPIPFGTHDHLGSFVQGPFVWHVFLWYDC